jgi:hypothetical protein
MRSPAPASSSTAPDLTHGEHRAEPADTADGRPSASRERLTERGSRRVPRWRHAEEHTSQAGQGCGEERHAYVELEGDTFRHQSRWNDRGRHAQRDPRQREASGAARQREHDAFSQEQPRQVPAARAKGGTYGHFSCAADATCQQQVGDVRASHQQDEGDNAAKDERGGSHFAADERVAQRLDGDAPSFVGLRRDTGDVLRDHIHVASRLVDRRARPQSRDNLKVVLAALLWGPPRRKRRPDVGRKQNLEARRHDADDGQRLAVEPDDTADGVRVTIQPAAPEPLADDDDAGLWNRASGPKVRPAIGLTPSTSKNAVVTDWPGMRSATPAALVSVRPPPATAAIETNA